jgi:hypothetical protein
MNKSIQEFKEEMKKDNESLKNLSANYLNQDDLDLLNLK